MPGLSSLLSTGSVLITLVCSILLFTATGTATPLSWISIFGDFQVNIGLLVGEDDKLAKGMMFIVTFIGTLVHIFSLGYMKDDEGKARYFAGLSIFMFSMTGIVLADNLVMMFIFWELVGVSSYILIGHWYNKNSAADAAKKAFLTNRIGDFGFMIGILLVWVLTKQIEFAKFTPEIISEAAKSPLFDIAVIAIFCGAIGKSAQVPLHVWLPDAMEGPTPVSALIHAATMVAAGVFMLARISVLIGAAEVAATVILWTGAITALVAALMALQQNDIKRILAYSTLSQLGYMVMAQGIVGDGSDAGMFHLYTHAFFKALLFLGAGAVIFACHHEQDIWKMGGLRKKMPFTFWTFAIGTAALIAVPGTSGFFSKEGILHAAHEAHHTGPWVIGLIVAFLTPFYMTRLFIVAFLGKSRTENADHAKEVPPIMFVPLAVLALFALFSAYKFPAVKLKATDYALSHGFHPDATFWLSLFGLIAGVGLAIWTYRGRDTERISIPLFANKFYIDEIYSSLIAFFQDAIAGLLDLIDRFVIDPFVARFPAMTAFTAGSFFRLFQVGNLQGYTFLFGAGVVALIWFLLF
ncbi:UNVERIFIED_CONTAM: hypothetical protein GTU68_004592 [Idotea baltica]|nr:hypothetical protein [Idotea baltica]